MINQDCSEEEFKEKPDANIAKKNQRNFASVYVKPLLIQVRVHFEMLRAALLNVSCAFVNAISYRADIFEIMLYGTEVKKMLKAKSMTKCTRERAEFRKLKQWPRRLM